MKLKAIIPIVLSLSLSAQVTNPGVQSINGAQGAFTFTGSGVNCVITTCTFSGAGGGIGGSGTLNFIPLFTPNGTTLGNSHLDDGQTTASTITSTEPIAVAPGGGVGGAYDFTEGTSSSATAGHDVLYADSTQHCLMYSANGAPFACIGQVNITPALTWTNCTVSSQGVCVTSGAVASVTAASIPSGFNHLRIVGTCTTSDTVGVSFAAQFNGDTGSNYWWEQMYVFGTGSPGTALNAAGSGGTTTHLDIGPSPGSTSVGNSAGTFDALISNYASTTYNKNLQSAGTRFDKSGVLLLQNYTGMWVNTAAITSIKIFSDNGGNITTGCMLTVYGVR